MDDEDLEPSTYQRTEQRTQSTPAVEDGPCVLLGTSGWRSSRWFQKKKHQKSLEVKYM